LRRLVGRRSEFGCAVAPGVLENPIKGASIARIVAANWLVLTHQVLHHLIGGVRPYYGVSAAIRRDWSR